MTAPRPAGIGRGASLRLGLLFGTLAFVQGVGEPTEGLIAQPVRSLLKSWGWGAKDVATFAALLATPWSLKPLFGLLTDFVPLAGSRRRGYLALTSASAVVALVGLAMAPIPVGANGLLLAWLIVPTVAVAFADVVTDALLVEVGQPLGLTGRLQSVQWASMYAATVSTGFVGGYLSQHGQQRLGFLICGLLSSVTLVLALFVIREPAREPIGGGLRGAIGALGEVARSGAVLGVGAFLFLGNFNPFSTSVLYMHMTRSMGFSEQAYGNNVSLLAVGCIAASLAYGTYCRRVPMRWLLHASIVLGILSTLAYWALSGPVSAAVVSLFVGLTYMTATLIQLDLAARVCPPRVAGTTFAVLMALSNLGMALSSWLGGDWYERGCVLWGTRTAFDVLVGVGAGFTASCWLILPFLPKDGGWGSGDGG